MTDAEIAADYSTATWLGNSYIVFNGTWYNGSNGDAGKSAFNGHDFGAQTAITLGGQAQTYGDNSASGHIVEMQYSVYPSTGSASTWNKADMVWFDYANNNNWFRTGTAYNEATVDIANLAAGSYKLNVYFQQQTGASSWIYDSNSGNNFIADFSIAATLSRTPTSLTGFSAESGTASAAQSFTVTATHLNGNLTVTAPTGYEVSTSSGSGYSGSVTLTRDANNKVTAQTVYVRLKSDAAVGSRTGNVTVSGGGTTEVTVSLTGAVTPKPPTKGTVTYPSNEAEGRVTIPWTKNTAGNDVMVVRVANNGTAPSPVNGTAYSTGSGLGGQIVYKGSATSYKDTGLTAGTDYDYYLFSVSGNYYSTGVKVDAKTSKAPRFGTTSVSKTTTVGSAASNTQTASGTPSGMTYSVTCTSGGATSGFSVNSSGVFSFTPTAAGTYVFTVSAANGVTAVSASSYTVTVTVTAAAPTVGSPSRTGTTAVGATLGGTVSSTGGATVTEWGVVYSASSLNTDPTVGGTGCTNVTASGTPGASAFTAAVSGLKANTEYKWKAYAVNSVGTGYTAVQTFTTPCMSAGPVVTPTPGNGTATFTWNDVGAVQYLLSLWTGGGGGSSTLVSENFQNFTSVGSYSSTESSQTINGKTWAYTSCIIAPTAAANGSGTKGNVQMQASNGILVFPPSLNGVKTVKVVARGGNSIKLQQNVNGSWTTLETWSLTSSGAEYTHTFSTAQNGVSLRIRADTSNAKYVHDVTILGESVTYVTGYGAEGAEVTSPVTVSGLTSGTTYNWSLKAVGGGTGCEEDGTPASECDYTVTPTMADVAPVWATTVGPWAATVSTLLSKTMTEFLSTLGSPAPTFAVAAQGTAPAGSYAVTSAGAFTFTPAEGDAGKSFVFRFTASNTQGSPTKDVTVNVGALAPTITEGAKTIGTTSATLPVTVNMRGAATSADITLVYGTTTSYGSSASVSPTRITSGLNSGTAVSGSISSGLTPGVVYYYKWTVKNSAGTTTQTGSFTTLDVAPAVASAGSLNVTVKTGVATTLAGASWATAGTHLTYALSSSVPAAQYTWNSGTGTLTFTPAAKGTYTFNLTASNGRGSATYAWTVTAVDLPTVTPGLESTSGTTASVPATVNAGGGATTVTFKYGTSEGTYNLNPASLSGGSVAANATAATVTANLTGLTQGQTYYYQWTAVNAGGTTVETGSFFQPGDSLEFPGGMNGWAQSGTTTRDAEFGGCYYTPAHQLAVNANPTFKEYKSGTWRGAGRQVYVNGDGDGSSFRYTETSNGGDNTLNTPYAGYYTLRGRASGSGDGLSVEYVAMYTEGAPVTITGASDNHETQGAGAVTVTATLSAAPSQSEKVFVRYSTDGWSTWQLRQMSVTGSTATYTIDGQEKGTLVEYYILTSPHAYVGTDPDLCTLRGLKSGTTNFAYSATVLPPTVTGVTAGYEKVALAWDLNAAGDAVMVIRYASLVPPITPPTDGTAYAADTSALGGTVVYGAYAHPSGSESLDNVVSQGTGYTYVFYSVKNNKYSEGVVRTAATKSLATPEVVAVETGEVTMDGAATGETYVLLRNTANSFSGSVSGGLPSVGATWGGAKVMYVGTEEDFTDTSVAGCGTYYYKVWLKAAGEDVWKGSAVDSTTIPTPSAPVLNAIADGTTTHNQFVVTWSAVAGAAKYRLDVWTGSSTTVNDVMTVSSLGITASSYNDGSFENKELSSDARYNGQLIQQGTPANIQTRATSPAGIVSTTSGGRATKVTVVWPSGATTNRELEVYGKTTAYTSSSDLYSSSTAGTLLGSLKYRVISATPGEDPITTTELTISGDYAYIGLRSKSNAMQMESITVTWEVGGGEAYVSGYQDKDVGNVTTYTVSGLSEETTYHVKVRAEGVNSSCTSGDSNVEDVTTKQDTSATTVTIANADGAGGTSAVGAGNVLAGQTVLVQGTKLTVASGSVDPTLTGMTFTTTGSATGSDIGTYRVRVTTSATWAAGETGLKGTVTAGAAGSHSVTFGSAQTLTAGTTYYVWIEAVTLPGATAERTVGVSALTGDNFTTESARKQGSTSATGAQTIYGAPTVGLTPGASGSATISGTVSGLASGATVELRRYESAEAAAGDTAGTAGTAVTVTSGAFEATGLEACRPYWFKARQTLNGYTGAWGAVQTAAAPGLTAPTGLDATPTTTGAALSWNSVAGALGYSVNVWHYEGGGGTQTATYTVASRTSVTTSGTLPDGAGQTFSSTYSTATQMTDGDSQTLTLTGFGGVRITGITLSMKSNAKAGAGSLTLKVGDNAAQTLASGKFNTSSWNGEWSGSYVTITKTLASPVMVDDGESVVIKILASENSLYCQSYTVKYESGTPVYDVTAGVPASGVTFSQSETGATVGGLLPNSEYGWSVAATGFGGCAGDGATDSFTTLEVAGAPVISTPLASAVEQLSGTISGTPGATMILKRYETAEAAAAGAAGGALGGVIVAATEGTGAAAGTWTFTDTGLDGCKTYYYKAWQKVTDGGVEYTSTGSNVASAQTGLGTPTLNAVGAGTQMTISWNAVPGAVSYYLEVATDIQFTRPTSGDAVLTEDFAGFTGTAEVTTLDGKTGVTGWSGSKVYAGAGTARLGTSNNSGYLTTPRIAAQSGGGTVYFDLKQWTATEGASLTVQISYPEEEGEDEEWIDLKTVTPTADFDTYSVALPAGAKTSDFWICFDTVSSKRVYIDNVRVVPLGAGSAGSLKYEATVTGAPLERTADGLEVGTTYYYRVTTTGGEECTTVTDIGSALTADAPIIQVSPKHYNFGTVNKNEGGKTATFTVRNTGSVVLKFNAVSLVQDGTAYSITSPAGSALTADLGAGQSRTYTVLFDPQNSGTRTATLRFGSDAFNVTGEIPPASGTPTYGNFDVPLEGTCYDPATADPTVYWLEVEDELRIEDTVSDHSMAQEADEPVLTVLAWHYNRTYRTLDRSSKAAKWTLYDPNGDVVTTTGGTRQENQFFTAVEDYVYDGKTCAKFSAPIPALGNGNAIRGTYHVKVKVYDSTGTYFTETTQFVPVETGWLFEDFTRADTEATGSGALENGWTAMASGGAVVGEAAIHADALELYGANGEFTGEAGRIAVVRDMSDVGYATNPHDFEGTGSWGFHFRTGAKTVGFANESTAGAFVLGSTEGTWLASSDDQVGYAVAMMDNAVRLVKFQGSLLAGGTITQLGSAQFSGAQGKLLAVRVDFVPGQDAVDEDAADDGVAHAAVPAKYRLYVKEVASTGGNPIAECTAADKVLEWEFPSVEDHDLKFGGMMWNHGVAQAGDKTGAMFDDIYLPHMTSQTEPMMFHVIDQDTEGPVFEDFDLPAAIAASTVNGSGLTVHGTVTDPSGIWTAATGASAPSWDSHAANPKWELWVNGVMKADGTPTSSPNGNGAGTEVAWTIDIPSGLSLPTTTDCELRLSAWDHDTDRQDDSTQGTAALQFTLCATTPAAPGWATVEGDGAEMAVLRWARSGGTYVVVRSDDEIGERATPPQGLTTAPVEGTTVYEGLGKVVYKGTGDNHLEGTWTAREFVVKPGSSNYFAVYGMTGDGETGYYFSAPTLPKAYQWTTSTTNAETGVVTVTEHTAVDESGVPEAGSVTEGARPLVTPKYEPGEGVDSFAYRTSVCDPNDENPEIQALPFNYETRPETGSGWGGPWGSGYGDAPDKWKLHDSSLLTGTTHYPAATGNKLYWKDTSTSSADEAKLTRNLDSANSGDLFVACILNYQYGGDNKWVTLGLLDADGHTLVSFGKQGGNNWNYAAISTVADNGSPFGDHRYQGYSPRELEPGHGHDYVVVGQLSRSEHKLRMWVFSGSDRIPEIFHEEPATDTPTALECVQADCDYSESLTVPAVAAIQLCAGSTADANTELGHVYFDEVRFAGTWEELFLFNAPEVYTFDFDKPENTTGIMVGTDTEGHRLWRVSDGALAHGNVGLNAQFGLYHRSGIQTASFTIKDDENHTLLKQASDLAPEIGGTAGRVTLAGRTGQAFSDWKTGSGGATGVAIPTNWIALDSNYVVEVTLRSTGGKEAVVTAASESGGAGSDELFFGEYGENTGYDNYLEIYNGTGHTIDLSDYWIVKMDNVTDPDEMLTKFANTANWADNNHAGRIGAGYVRVLNGDSVGNMASGETSTSWPEGPFKLPHRATVCIVPNNAGTSFVKALLGNDCRVIALNVQGPMAVSGDDPQMLMYKEGATAASQLVGCEWIDMAGLTKPGRPSIDGDEGQYIMYRLESTVEVPRRYPKVVNWDEWDYRNWLAEDKVEPNAWSNLLATAGAYDKNIGLGGNMEFMVYDDDIEPPTMVRGGLRVRKADGSLEEEYREVSAGDRTFVVGGWSFTNWPAGKASAGELTLEDYQWIASMWPGGLTQNGGVSWSSELGGTDLAGWANVIEAGDNKGQSNVEFDGISQRKYGNMIARASASYAQDDEVWLGFDLDVAQLTEGVLSFGFAGGNAGFKSARVEWSATGEEGSFKMPNEWNFDPNSGGATTWTEWSRSLDPASTGIPASAGHLWFRVYLSDYGTTSGTFRMDNIRVEGAPSVVRVTDAEICSRGMQFEVHVKDEASGLDAGTTGAQSGDDGKAYFDCGLEMDEYRTVTLANGGKAESTITWTAADGSGNEVTTGWGPLTAQNWYEQTQAGHGKLRMSVPDKDDDRPNDQTMLSTDFGMLMVEDDDATPPVLEMDSMKPRQEGTMAEWLLAEKTTLASESMEALVVGALGLNTTEGTTSRPRYSLRSASDTGLSAPTYAVYQSGWQAGSKFWTVKIRNTSAGAGTITKISFASQVGSVLAPTGYTVKYAVVSGGVSGDEAGTTWSGSLLTSGSAWVKEGAEGVTGSPIKTWVAYEKTVAIPLAASGSSGDEVELRIYGTGTDPKGIGATWYLWNLKIEGTISVPGVGGEDGYTYVTDSALAQPGGASLPMSGSVYDAGSGLLAVPTYELRRGSAVVSSGSISFKEERALSARTAKNLGEFEQDIAVSGLGYGDLALAEYKGTVHAEDADADRNSAADGSGTNYDSLEMDGQFAFTVIDQDLVGPTAPANVKVNGVAVGLTAPDRLTVTWTNNPEFLVEFDVAEDVVPTAENLADATWLAAHGVAAASVKKASLQTGAAGIGEYRVALTTGAAALSNAPAFSVAVTEGAVANYGFERRSEALQAWRLTDNGGIRAAGERAFPGSTTVAPIPCEGTNSLFVPDGNVGGTGGGGAIGAPQSQVILFTNTAHVMPKVGGSFWYYKVKDSSSPRVRISAYPNEDMVAEERLGFRVVNPSTGSTSAGEWHQAEFEFEEIGNGNANCILLELYSGTAFSFFDDVRIGVDVGTGNLPTMRYVATGPEAQGLNAKYLFAVDADNNRAQDRMVGGTAPFYTAYDITPPTAVEFKSHGKGASTDSVDDPTTQFDLTWFSNDIGPDDPEDANYQTGWSGKEVLSPWGTYRVYYRTYDPVALEAAAADAGKSTETYLYETLIEGTDAQGRPKYHDVQAGWKHVENGDEIEDVTAPVVGGKRKYSGWDQITKDEHNQQTVRLYDLDFDQEYVVVIVGVDKAGNEGPVNAKSWTTNNTIKFSITRGWHMPKSEAVTALSGRVTDIGQRLTNTVVSALEWTAAGMTRNAESGQMEGEATKDYDLLQWDARSFRESPDNDWKLLQTVKTNWFVDDGGPTNRGAIRFYRASYKDRWKKAVTNRVNETDVVTAQTPLVSEEVYAQTAIPLRPGWNFVALHGVPYTNTLRGVFGGKDEFPGGSHAALGTCIDFYEPATGEARSDRYWLDQDGLWHADNDETGEIDLSDTLLDTNLFTRAFSIELPNNIPEKYLAGTNYIRHGSGSHVQIEEVPYMLWKPILQVPTNGFSRLIEAGTENAPKYNIVALRLPVATHPSKMNLVESGFTPGDPWVADQIYTIDPVTREPGHSCYCDSERNWKFVSGGAVPGDYFKPNDVLVIVSKNGPDWTWRYNPAKFYTLPNRHMQAE